MSDNPLSGKVGLDTTDFKTSISQMNRDIRVIESGFRASSAALGDWGKSADGLEMRIKSLTDEMDIQRKKVSVLKSEYEKIAKEKGENSRAAQDLQIRINKETEALNRNERELKDSQEALDKMGEESKETGKQVNEMGNKLDTASKKTLNFKSALSGIGNVGKLAVKAIAGIAVAAGAATAAVGGAIAGMVVKATDAAGELVDMSLKTGLSVKTLQELSYVGGQVGTDIDTVASSLAKFTRSMGDAKEGTKQYKDAFEKLGIPITDTNGELRDSRTVMFEALDALGKMPNETEREALALDLFGRSAMELNPLIKAGSEELNRLTKEANKNGSVMSDKNVFALEALGDMFDGLKKSLKGMTGTFAAAFLPEITKITGKAQEFIGKLSTIISTSGGDFGKMAQGVSGLIGEIFGVSDIQIKTLIDEFKTAITFVRSDLLPTIGQIAKETIKFIKESVIPFIKEHGPQIKKVLAGLAVGLAAFTVILKVIGFVQGLITVFSAVGGAISTVGGVIGAIVAALGGPLTIAIAAIIALIALFAAAWSGNWGGIQEKTATVIEFIKGVIQSGMQFIQNIIQAVLPIIQSVFAAFSAAFQGDWTAFGENLRKAWDGAWNLITGIVQTAWDTIKLAVSNLVSDVIASFTETDWGEVGSNIVQGIANGITSAIDWIVKAAEGVGKAAIDAIKGFLGIKSPSQVMALQVGLPMGLGIGVGFQDALPQISRQMRKYVEGMVADIGAIGLRSNFSGLEQQIKAAVGGMGAMGYSFGGADIPANLNMGSGGVAPISITIQATVANDLDMHLLARRISEEIRRMKS
ncbi:MAG: hypothetical protein ABFD29_02135 [Anaerolineaceae bacterium]